MGGNALSECNVENHYLSKDKEGKPADATVRVTDVYRKIKGKWLIVHEHVSVAVDISTGKPDFSSKL